MRIRTIKPEFYLHEGLFELERESGLPIRLAFTGLWCVADREGRFKWEPRKIGVQILPYDAVDFPRVLDALITRGFVRKYAVDSVEYGWIPSFTRHQVINNRERPSDLPEPTDSNICDACQTREPRVPHAGKAEGKGREGKGTGKGKESFAPDGASSDPVQKMTWTEKDGFIGIKDDDLKRWREAYPALNLQRQIAAASEWLRVNPAKRKSNYPRFLSGWFTRAQEKGGDIPSNRSSQSPPRNQDVTGEILDFGNA